MKDYTGHLKVASYNINCLRYGAQMDEICAEIAEIDPDIIGLQEVDRDSKRSGQGDQVQMMAEKLGYPYYYFSVTLNHKSGGDYGHGILSKYPILETKVKFFDLQPEEVRNYERHELDVNGKTLAFYNVHLCLGSDEARMTQLKELLVEMEQDEYAVLTGDLNSHPQTFRPLLNQEKFSSLNGGGDGENFHKTCPENERSTVPIDHIIVSRSMDHAWFEDDTGVIVNRTENSDHNLIYTYVNFK